MTDSPNPMTDPDVWVDFNDIQDGHTTALLAHVNCSPRRLTRSANWPVSRPLVVGDHEGSRCTAFVTEIGKKTVRLRLLLESFSNAPKVTDLAAAYPLSPGERVRGGIRFPAAPQTEAAQAPSGERVPDAAAVTAAEVHTLGEEHTEKHTKGSKRRRRGCPQCLDSERVTQAEALLRVLNPDLWPDVASHTARYMLAADDLKFTAPLAGGLIMDGPVGALHQTNYFGPPPSASADLAEQAIIAERARRQRDR